METRRHRPFHESLSSKSSGDGSKRRRRVICKRPLPPRPPQPNPALEAWVRRQPNDGYTCPCRGCENETPFPQFPCQDCFLWCRGTSHPRKDPSHGK